MKTNTKSYVYKCKGYREQNRKRVNKTLLVMTVIYSTVISLGWAIKSYDSLLKDFNTGTGVAIVTAARAETVGTPVLEIRDKTAKEIIIEVANRKGFKDVQLLIDIAFCESSLNYRAYNLNKNGSGDTGLFQFNTIHNFGEKPLDPYWATEKAIEWIRAGRISAWYSSKSCWSK